MIRAALVLSLYAAPGLAQVEAEAARLLDRFIDLCPLALNDPNAYAATLTVPGPNGERVAVNSPDGNYLWVIDGSGGFYEDVQIAVAGPEQMRYCQVESPALAGYDGATLAAAFEAAARARPGLVVTGGRIEQDYPGHDMPAEVGNSFTAYRYMFAGHTSQPGDWGWAWIEDGHFELLSARMLSSDRAPAADPPAADPPAAEAAPAPDGAALLRAAAEACLRNYRLPEGITPALAALGLSVAPGMDAGSFEVSGGGLWGIVTPGAEQSYCTFQAEAVPLSRTLEIGAELATTLFPGAVQPGHPERGAQTPCDGYSIFAPRRLLWMHFADAGNGGTCTGQGGSAIILNM